MTVVSVYCEILQFLHSLHVVQSDRALEYTDCFAAEG